MSANEPPIVASAGAGFDRGHAREARHAVVSGASIAGLSTAFWLRRAGWRVTVIERAPAFRDGGQNVDVRGTAREVLDRMGLTEAIRAQNTTETATVLVDASGRVTTELPSDGPDGATAELEVLRGDFARTILDHLPPGVEIVYGDSITTVDHAHLDPDHDAEHGTDHNAEHGTGHDGPVTVTTVAGRRLVADLLVVAEGVRSTSRDLVFGSSVDAHDVGITMAFGTIARTEDDDTRWRWYTTAGGRQVHLRPDNHGTTRAILAFAGEDELDGLDQHGAVARLRARFGDAGWQAPRVLAGFASSEDLYIDRLTQIHMSSWHRGPVCLVGDAAWCVTPIGGGGASLALMSGYVLAAQLSTPGLQISVALDAFEDWMRPVVESVQKLPRGIDHLAYPRTRLGVRISALVTQAMTSRPLSSLTSNMTKATDTDRPLPTVHLPDSQHPH